MDPREEAKRRHPAYIAQEERRKEKEQQDWNGIVANYHSNVVATDPHATTVAPPAHPIAQLAPTGQIRLFADSDARDINEKQARQIHRELGQILDQVTAERLNQGEMP
jgi:hypothetical protein